MFRVSFPVTILLAFVIFQEVKAACYFRNGTATTADFSPCSNDTSNALSTVCCATWDTCLPNGLCQSYDKVIWRESCTKKNWDEGGCQEMCSNEREAQRNSNVKVTSCDGKGNVTSTTWCCGSSDACCTAGSGISVYTLASRFGDPIPTPVPSSSTSVASSSAAVSTSPPAASSSAPTTPNGGLTKGAKAGIGAGVALGVIALIALGIFIYKAMQWRKQAQAAAPPYSYARELDSGPVEVYRYQEGAKPAQLSGIESAVHEMPSSKDMQEVYVAPSSPDTAPVQTPVHR
ncbi:uncharacterized protein K460DRAFT_417283 [Cucurbitaria berberidis CBS 394.84]|uniref:Mid2 domain-containing protein n=1 Tax=Cucurbitaria berberidis CBS 394.84 TaxID=1168544 RepID=A0A9P4L992_9PLEO|nr:uncharacterized protein K460DRAFT_417283 [Cucurbitaria berberidis CBS 394.84]KAF1846142.1 hypothetical protein K460DRAFT_417283 [Cucurbitaria berberidis CBS 394.84]